LESPAGVGFSLCPDRHECRFDDNNSADDNLQAVLAMLQKFPEIQNNDLYIAGESYAGIYVPKLVDRLDKYIQANSKSADVYVPNLKGFMVGNGVTDWRYDTTPAFLQLAYYQGIFDEKAYQSMQKNCDFKDLNFGTNTSIACEAAILKIYRLTAQLNTYDMFGKCYQDTGSMTL